MTYLSATQKIEQSLTCKPGYEDEIKLIDVSELSVRFMRPIAIERKSPGQRGLIDALNACVAEASESDVGHTVRIMADGDQVYMVNSEGYDYARYIGKLTKSDSERVLSANPALTVSEYVAKTNENKGG